MEANSKIPKDYKTCKSPKNQKKYKVKSPNSSLNKGENMCKKEIEKKLRELYN